MVCISQLQKRFFFWKRAKWNPLGLNSNTSDLRENIFFSSLKGQPYAIKLSMQFKHSWMENYICLASDDRFILITNSQQLKSKEEEEEEEEYNIPSGSLWIRWCDICKEKSLLMEVKFGDDTRARASRGISSNHLSARRMMNSSGPLAEESLPTGAQAASSWLWENINRLVNRFRK